MVNLKDISATKGIEMTTIEPIFKKIIEGITNLGTEIISNI